MFSKIHLPPKGFTLIELMIVISIVGIFSSLTIINFRGNEKIRDMDNQANVLLDGIKSMQTSALSGKMVSEETPMSYIIEIADCSSDCSYNLKAQKIDLGYLDIANVLLDKSVVDIEGANSLEIIITPPRGNIKIYINGDHNTSLDEVVINLKHISDSTISKNVRINSISGRMDILNP